VCAGVDRGFTIATFCPSEGARLGSAASNAGLSASKTLEAAMSAIPMPFGLHDVAIATHASILSMCGET
jgi:hypothetical protein